MNIWQFASENPLTALILTYLVMAPVRYAYRAYRLRLRAKNIALHGWPEPPLDADGDVHWPEKDERVIEATDWNRH